MTPRHPYGKILRDGDRVGLHFERHFRHTPERVWRALTDSDDLRHWLPTDIVGPREQGATIELPFWPDVVEQHDISGDPLPGHIIEWDPPRVFAWRWDTDDLRFELTPTADGTRLVFTTWIGETPGVELTAAGYHVCLDQLVELVDTGTTEPFVDQDPTDYERAYTDMLAESLPTD